MPETDSNLTPGQEGDAVAVYLAEIAALEQAATPGPWWTDENERVWRLHGVAGIIPAWPADGGGILVPDQVINKQIAKAPKQGTPYAEYWPDAADEAFIVAARSAVPRLLGAVEKVLALHRPGEITETTVCTAHAAGSTWRRSATLPEFRAETKACPDCTERPKVICAHCECPHDLWPCPTHEAITAELTGKDGTDGS